MFNIFALACFRNNTLSNTLIYKAVARIQQESTRTRPKCVHDIRADLDTYFILEPKSIRVNCI